MSTPWQSGIGIRQNRVKPIERSGDRLVRQRDQFLFGSLMVLLVILPLPFGGNQLWAWPFAAALIFCLMAIWLMFYIIDWVRTPSGLLKGGAGWSGFFLILVAIWIGLQSIEVPKTWLSLVSPKAAELWDKQGMTPTTSISLDPAVTSLFALRSAAYAVLFFLFLLLVNSAERLRFFLYALVISGTFQALYGGLMVLSGLEYSFFLKKEFYRGMATGTFVNRNHLAGYLEMALAAGLGLLVAGLKGERHEHWRARLRHWLRLILSETAVLRLALVIMALGLVLTRSRMGNAGFLASLSITGGLALLLSRSAKRSTVLLFVSVIVIDIALIGSWFGVEKVIQRVEQTSLTTESRDDVNEFVWPMVKDFWITGSGAGSFRVIFPHYVTADLGEGFYEHAHNDYFEFWSELGVMGCFPLLLAVLLSLIAAFRALACKDDSLTKGAGFASLMGITSLLIHSSVDFNLQMPANAATYVTLLAMPSVALSIRKNGKSKRRTRLQFQESR
jgi:O-antigen ligase